MAERTRMDRAMGDTVGGDVSRYTCESRKRLDNAVCPSSWRATEKEERWSYMERI